VPAGALPWLPNEPASAIPSCKKSPTRNTSLAFDVAALLGLEGEGLFSKGGGLFSKGGGLFSTGRNLSKGS
jgi:hypothetical protein